jgi:pilus assembly protein CpaC
MLVFRSRVEGDDRPVRRALAIVLVALVIAASRDMPVHGQPPPPPAPGLGVTAPRDEPALAPPPGPQVEVAPRFSEESEIPTSLPKVPVAPARPAQGANSIGSFVDTLHGNDATLSVLVNQARILTLKQDITEGPGRSLVAVGDPTIVDFTILSPRQIRINGRGIGVTDLSITTARNEIYSFELRVLADLTLIQGKLRDSFTDASIKLSQFRDHIVVEGEARDPAQITRIIETINAYLASVFVEQARTVTVSQTGQVLGALQGQGPGTAGQPAGAPVGPPAPGASLSGGPSGMPGVTVPVQPLTGLAPYATSAELGGPTQTSARGTPPQIINLMRVAGSQQVLLKVRIAELNRTAMRRIGADLGGVGGSTASIVGSQIAAPVTFQGTIGQQGSLITGNQLFGFSRLSQNANNTVFGIFQHAGFEFSLNALRDNGLLKILAEPNLVALNGQNASFLAGGEFPVPVPQVSAAGVAPTITVRFREFGVRLGFVPYILDGDVIRLTVAPEVSNIDFTIAVTLVQGGTPVPGLNTRKAQTTVELREGQTLAIAGLLQLTLNGDTARIPGLGDLPILGPFFSNTSSQRIEKELLVLVTPYLIEPMAHGQVPPTPGDEVKDPNDLELYLLNRIESRTGTDFRATTKWDDPLGLRYHLNLERKYINGPVGFSE